MTAARSSTIWRWADPQGTQRFVRTDELRTALGSGSLPPFTLVWREGMSDWQPAYQVEELASIAVAVQRGITLNIPPPPLALFEAQAQFEKRSPAAAAGGAQAVLEPPAPPVHQYATLAAATPVAAAGADLGARSALEKHRGAAPAPAAPKPAPDPAHAPKPAADGPAAADAPIPPSPPSLDELELDGLPTLVRAPSPFPDALPTAAASAKPSDEAVRASASSAAEVRVEEAADLVPKSSSLPAPPGSKHPRVPPPPPARRPNSLPPPSVIPPAPSLPSLEGLGWPPSVDSDREGGALPSFPLETEWGKTPAVQPGGGAHQALGARISAGAAKLRSSIGPSLRRAKDFAGTRLARASAHAGPSIARAAATLAARIKRLADYALRHPRDLRVWAGAAAAVALLVSMVLLPVALVRGANRAWSTSPTPAGSAAPGESGQPAAPALAACRAEEAPWALAPVANKDVPLELVPTTDGIAAYVGFAANERGARGLRFDMRSGTASEVFSREAGGVRDVAPFLSPGGAAFAIANTAPDEKLHVYVPLSASPPLVLGEADGSLAIASRASETPRKLFALEGGGSVESLRVTEIEGRGHALVFRHRDAIWAGRLDGAHAPREHLVRVAGASGDGVRVGAPQIAYNGQTFAVAFAEKVSTNEPWSIRLGFGAPNQLPDRAERFEPGDGRGGLAIAPSIAGLPGGRWLITWTEEEAGVYRVRGQTLTPAGSPIGAPFTLSRPGASAGQAVVRAAGPGAAAVFLERTGSTFSLWGVALTCP